MKKIALIFSLAVLLVLGLSTAALAATNGPHGGFTTNTASCAQCHKTHTAQSSHLILFALVSGSQNDIYRTCTYCHSSTGSSHYDEVDGEIKDGSNLWATSAGGFQSMPTVEGATSYTTMATVSSKHNADQANNTLVAIPGGSSALKFELRCDSCHDPHGTQNARQLVPTVTVWNTLGTAYNTVSTIPNGAISMTVNNPTTNETITYNDDHINDFCGACHTDYLQTAVNSGSTQSGTYTSGLYRHRVGMAAAGASGYNAAYFALPTSSPAGDVLCVTCHYAHGTTAAVSSTTYANGSTLLRMDERGVCQDCHRKTFSTSQPAVVAASSYQVSATDKNHVVLAFNSYMEKVSAQTAGNYTVTGTGVTGVSSAQLQPNGVLGKTVLLTLNGSLTTGSSYTITVNTTTVKDLNGLAVSSTGNTFTFSSK